MADTMRRRLRIALIAFVAVALTVGVTAKFVAPRYARDALLKHLRKDCPSCVFEIGTLRFALHTGRVEGQDIRVKTDPRGSVVYEVHTDRAIVSLDWLSLLGKKKPHVRDIRVEGPSIRIQERESSESGGKKSHSSLPELRVDHAEVIDGNFRYEAIGRKPAPKISFTHIDAETEEFNSLHSDEYAQPLEIHLEAKGPSSGKITIRAKIWLEAAARKHAHLVQIRIQDYDLQQTNSFFTPEEAVELRGFLKDAQATVSLFDQKLEAKVRLSYRDLKLHFISGKKGDEDQSGAEATLKNLAEKLKVPSTRPEKEGEPPPEAEVMRLWDGDQGVVGFILRSVGEAAQTIMKKEEKKPS